MRNAILNYISNIINSKKKGQFAKSIISELITLMLLLPILGLGIWLFTDLKITRWGSTDITVSNFAEAFFWTKRDIFWAKSLEVIDTKINDDHLKNFLLEKYARIIPVHQWWSPLRDYKNKALMHMFAYFIANQQWQKLEEYSQEYIKINPNDALGWYHLGLSQQHQNDEKNAVKSYKTALLIDSTHLASIIQLAKIIPPLAVEDVVVPLVNNYQQNSKLQEVYSVFWTSEPEEKFSVSRHQYTTTKIGDQTEFILNPPQKIHSIRIDPPKGEVEFISITFFNNNSSFKINNFSDWKLSPYTKRLTGNTFINTGNDPFIYHELETPLENVSRILLKADVKYKDLQEIKNAVKNEF